LLTTDGGLIYLLSTPLFEVSPAARNVTVKHDS